MVSDNEKDFSLSKSNNITKKPNFFDRVFDYFSRETIIIKVVVIVGVFSILLGVFGIYFKIKNSFVDSQIVLEDRAFIIEYLNRTKDTDGDGLPDYDELYIYNTSPYLVDSDLDGISDYDAVMSGRVGTNLDVITPNLSQANYDFLSPSSVFDIQSMTLNDFKKYLLQMGYEEVYVSALTEAEFSEIKQTLMTNTSLDNSSNINTPLSEEEKIQLDQMRNLSPSEIRELMIQGGATKEQLDKFTDQELQELYLQTLDEISKP